MSRQALGYWENGGLTVCPQYVHDLFLVFPPFRCIVRVIVERDDRWKDLQVDVGMETQGGETGGVELKQGSRGEPFCRGRERLREYPGWSSVRCIQGGTVHGTERVRDTQMTIFSQGLRPSGCVPSSELRTGFTSSPPPPPPRPSSALTASSSRSQSLSSSG